MRTFMHAKRHALITIQSPRIAEKMSAMRKSKSQRYLALATKPLTKAPHPTARTMHVNEYSCDVRSAGRWRLWSSDQAITTDRYACGAAAYVFYSHCVCTGPTRLAAVVCRLAW